MASEHKWQLTFNLNYSKLSERVSNRFPGWFHRKVTAHEYYLNKKF